MKINNINGYIFGFVIVVFFSCGIPKTVQINHQVELPKKYQDTNQIGSLTLQQPKDFFQDTFLKKLIDTAIVRNFDLRIFTQKNVVANHDYLQSRGMLLPTVQYNSFFQQRKFGYYTMDDAGNRVTEFYPGKLIPTHLPDYFGGFQTNWELDVWGKLKNKKKAAFLRLESSYQGRNLLKTVVVEKVASLYFELLALDQELVSIRESIEIQKNAVEVLKVQKSSGVTNELSVKQFQALLHNYQSMEFEIMRKQQLIEYELNEMLGRYNLPVLRNMETLNNDSVMFVKQGVPSELLNYRPDIKSAELELLAAKCDVISAKAAFYPTLNILGSIGLQSFDASLLWNFPKSVAYNFLGGVTGPLINRSAIKAHFNRASAGQMEAILNYQKTILKAYFEVSSELSNLKYLNEMKQLKLKEVDELYLSLNISKELFITGKASYLEVLTIQKNALQSKMEIIDLQKAEFLSKIRLYKALGGGW